MPLPFSPLNLATASSSAFCCGPESACHSVTSTGPVMSRSASVDCWGAGAAALQAALHGPHLGMVRHDERPEERVPAPEEAHERHRDERGDRDRQNDAPEETEVPRTVDPRCVRELSRHREEELPEEEDREGGREKGQDLHLIRVSEVQIAA